MTVRGQRNTVEVRCRLRLAVAYFFPNKVLIKITRFTYIAAMRGSWSLMSTGVCTCVYWRLVTFEREDALQLEHLEISEPREGCEGARNLLAVAQAEDGGWRVNLDGL